MPKISVIVPVYNVERYLPLCLDSLRAQTLDDIEIICINDGSSDRSRDILACYAGVDSRIIVVDKNNGGLSSARNAGVEAANSEYICFVDSDDMLEKNACEIIVGAFRTYECDVLTFGGHAFPSHLSNPWLEASLNPRDVVYEGFDPALLFKENSHPYVWRTALRRSFIIEHNLQFDEDIRFGEDELFHFALYTRSSRTVLLSNQLYLYRVSRDDSLMATRSDDAYLKTYDHLRIIEHIAADWYQLGIIELYHRELLAYFARFVFRDIIASSADNRMILLRYIRGILETYFSREQLEYLIADPIYGNMAKAFLDDSRLAWRGKRKKLLYCFTLTTDPIEFLRAGWRRFWSFGILRRIRGDLVSILPMSSRRQKLLYEELIWKSCEIEKLSESKILLDYEMLNSK